MASASAAAPAILSLEEMKKQRLSPAKLSGGRLVRVSYTIFKVAQINTSEQTFYADFKLYIRWIDPELTDREDGMLDPDEIWTPRWYIANAVELEEMHRRIRLKKGAVHEQVRCRGTLSEFFELEKFPFDYQELHIDISSHSHLGKVEFVTMPERLCTMDDDTMRLQSWMITGHGHNVNKTYLPEVNTGFSHFVSYVLVMRSAWYYFNNVILLMFLLVLFCFSVSAVEPEDFGTRSSITLTILLTAVALKFAVSDSLPHVAFMTILDVYLLAAFLFLFAMGIENWAIARLLRSSVYSEGTLHDWDDALTLTWLVAWFGFQIVFGVYCVVTTNCCAHSREEAVDEVSEILEVISMYTHDDDDDGQHDDGAEKE